MQFITGSVSNRPAPAAGATGAGTTGGGSTTGATSAAPKLPPGATPNPDGTFNFAGNTKVPAGTYKMNADGSITRVR